MENGRKAGAIGPMKKHRIWPVLLAAGIGFCILCGLGVWQVKRLAWKEALIADFSAGISAAPTSYEDVPTRKYGDYAKLVVRGTFVGNAPFRLIASQDGVSGWRLVQPFVTDSNFTLLVDRGILVEGITTQTPNGHIELLGISRRHDGKRGFFDPENDVSGNRWYWWDKQGMFDQIPGSVTMKPDSSIVLQLLPGSPGTDGLIVTPPKAELRNNHLGYAITWFGLAAALVGVTGAFIWRSTRS
jgi:surfeit locus 1 family protein